MTAYATAPIPTHPGMQKCGLAGCHSPEFTAGICGKHYLEFCVAPEYARVKTAVADWHRRLESEK